MSGPAELEEIKPKVEQEERLSKFLERQGICASSSLQLKQKGGLLSNIVFV